MHRLSVEPEGQHAIQDDRTTAVRRDGPGCLTCRGDTTGLLCDCVTVVVFGELCYSFGGLEIPNGGHSYS